MWSDGCSAQYKSKLPFFFVSESRLEWVFFGSRHGKSPCDACGGVVKVVCDEDVKNGAIIQSADDMFRHLSKHHCLPEEHRPPTNCCHTLRSFRLVKDVQCTLPSSALNTIPGTRQIHHVKGLGNCQLKKHNMACFCDSCLQIKEGSCMSSHVVNDWVTTKVSFTRTRRDDPANQCKEPVSSVSSALVTPLSEDSAPVTPLSEDPAPNTAPDPNSVCRETVFDQLQNEMAAATSYAGVPRMVVRTAESVKNFPVAAQPGLYVTAIPQGSIDAVSLPLKPDDAPPHHFPVWVLGDGNCLLCTLSILAIGHLENFVEMRMRIVTELTINIARYVSPSYLANGSSTTGATLLEYLMLDADIPFSQGLTPLEVLQAEIIGVCKPSADFNMWGVYAAANILKVPVTSVHRDKGEAHKKLLAKRTVWPTQDHTLLHHVDVPSWWHGSSVVVSKPLRPTPATAPNRAACCCGQHHCHWGHTQHCFHRKWQFADLQDRWEE